MPTSRTYNHASKPSSAANDVHDDDETNNNAGDSHPEKNAIDLLADIGGAERDQGRSMNIRRPPREERIHDAHLDPNEHIALVIPSKKPSEGVSLSFVESNVCNPAIDVIDLLGVFYNKKSQLDSTLSVREELPKVYSEMSKRLHLPTRTPDDNPVSKLKKASLLKFLIEERIVRLKVLTENRVRMDDAMAIETLLKDKLFARTITVNAGIDDDNESSVSQSGISTQPAKGVDNEHSQRPLHAFRSAFRNMALNAKIPTAALLCVQRLPNGKYLRALEPADYNELASIVIEVFGDTETENDPNTLINLRDGLLGIQTH